MNTPHRRLFLALLVASAPACVHHTDFSKVPTPSGAALLREVDQLESYVTQVKGSARVSVQAKEGSGETGAFVAARAPREVHLELLDFFGSPSQVLVSDGHVFGLYQKDKGTFFTGTASAATISRLLPVHLSAEELVAILLGHTPRLPGAPDSVEPDPDADAYRVTLVAGDRRQTLWIHPVSKRVQRSVLEGPGGYTLVFDQVRTADGMPFARKVTFQDSSATVVLRWGGEDVELDGPLDPALFRVGAPPGARVVEVDAKGAGAG
jgi:outer membrane lipoprotein-sorting protein